MNILTDPASIAPKFRKPELPQLTGVRGVAAFFVVMFHLREMSDDTNLGFGWFDAFVQRGFFGVDLFFILSGFILSYVYSEAFRDRVTGRAYLNFFKARVARLYPVHIVMMILMLGAYWIGKHKFGTVPHNDAQYAPLPIGVSFLLLQSWFGFKAPDGASWSVSVELASYIAFPFLTLATLRLPRWWPFLSIPLLWIVMALVGDSGGMVRGCTEFCIGVSVFTLYSRWPLSLPFKGTSIILFLLPFVICQGLDIPYVAVPAVCFTFCMLGLARGGDWLSRFCAWRPIYFLGEISYSLYLSHWFVWVSYKHAIQKLVPAFNTHLYLMVFCALLTVLPLATLLYLTVEMPGRRLLRSIKWPGAVASSSAG